MLKPALRPPPLAPTRLRVAKPRKVKTVKVNSDLDPTGVKNCQGPWLTSGWECPHGGGSGAPAASAAPVRDGTGRRGDEPREPGSARGRGAQPPTDTQGRPLPGSPALPGGSGVPSCLLSSQRAQPRLLMWKLCRQRARKSPAGARGPGPTEAWWVGKVPRFCA